jgi:hypothetical protein
MPDEPSAADTLLNAAGRRGSKRKFGRVERAKAGPEKLVKLSKSGLHGGRDGELEKLQHESEGKESEDRGGDGDGEERGESSSQSSLGATAGEASIPSMLDGAKGAGAWSERVGINFKGDGEPERTASSVQEEEEEEEPPSWMDRIERCMRNAGTDQFEGSADNHEDDDNHEVQCAKCGGSMDARSKHDMGLERVDGSNRADEQQGGDGSRSDSAKATGARAGDDLLRILNELEVSNKVMDSTGYEEMLKTFARRDSPQDVLFIWEHMRQRRVKPTYLATEYLLAVCAKHGLHATALDAGNATIASGMHVDRRTYLQVLKTCSKLKEHSIILELFAELRAANIVPGRKIHAIFFESCMHLGAAEPALKELTLIRQTRRRPPSKTMLDLVIETCLKAGRKEDARPLMREVSQRVRHMEDKARARDREKREQEGTGSSATVSVDTALTLHGYPKAKGHGSGGEDRNDDDDDDDDESDEIEEGVPVVAGSVTSEGDE